MDTSRTLNTTVTYVKKTCHRVLIDSRSDHEAVRIYARDQATEFAWRLLWELQDLVHLINPSDDTLEAEALARKIADRLRQRRLAEKLSNTEGRTPEESALFRARAEELS